MAIAHFHADIIGSGRNVLWLAAQRHRVRMHDELNGCMTAGVDGEPPAYEEIMLPDDAPRWIGALVRINTVAKASETIWNKITMEERANGQLAREITVALPVELSSEQNIALMQDFVKRHIVAMGVVADWVFHDWDGNPHARLLHTIRPVVEDGFGRKTIVVRDEHGHALRRGERNQLVYRAVIGGKNEFLELRKFWGDVVNRHLAAAGHAARIDMRSYKEQGIDMEPTVHVGSAKIAIARRRHGF